MAHDKASPLILYFGLFAAVALLIGVAGCSTSSQSLGCEGNTDVMIQAGSCLHFEDEGQLDEYRDRIIAVVKETYSLVNSLMPIDDVQIRVLANPQNVIPELGMNGYNPGANEVILYFDPQSNALSHSLESSLSSILSHELHHAKRKRSAGYGSTLLQAMISEGLADHFSMEVTQSGPPIWSKVLTETQLESLLQKASQDWNSSPYNHSQWFFGNGEDIPRWTGYSIGFELVQIYLMNHPDSKASILHEEPASSFAPE
ncbi:DUF2268 domain-containing protein [Balneolaceae bacterium YR4-1]|uniref:DUF2268 domain-containing protein n=1 Tax=Halalkalibaculum roseum TaxID=2709311 RepID=A0A6M1SP51_9BACT|nr:DUF2268 domain-containing putative Zn-dependent protease [Halalkalibaculum roseum]NGP76859.1 DUF2268 domain-containing protein [Halalkalibaculum roseum]